MTQTVALALETDGPGGAEIFLLNSALELRRRGRDVVPLLPSGKSGWLGRLFAEQGFIAETFVIRRPYDPPLVRDIAHRLAARGVTALHSHEFAMGVFGTAIARRLKVPHVITLHANMWMTDALRRRMVLRWAIRRSHATTAVSEHFRRHLRQKLGRAAEGIVAIPNGIPTPVGDADSIRREFSLRADEVVIVATGNLTERKGHIHLLRAVAKIRADGCAVPLRVIIAGEGPERPALESFSASSGLTNLVHLPGVRQDIGALVGASHILVMPSIWEGMPLSILEGMHCANAIVASNVGGIPETVRDGVDGLLTPPTDVPALASALRQLLEDPTCRKRMGQSAQERARREFSIGGMMDRYEALYAGR